MQTKQPCMLKRRPGRHTQNRHVGMPDTGKVTSCLHPTDHVSALLLSGQPSPAASSASPSSSPTPPGTGGAGPPPRGACYCCGCPPAGACGVWTASRMVGRSTICSCTHSSPTRPRAARAPPPTPARRRAAAGPGSPPRRRGRRHRRGVHPLHQVRAALLAEVRAHRTRSISQHLVMIFNKGLFG